MMARTVRLICSRVSSSCRRRDLPMPGRPGDEHGARRPLLDALLELGHELRDLLLPADRGRRPAEQPPDLLVVVPRSAQHPHAGVILHLEPGLDQVGRDAIDRGDVPAAPAQHLGGAIDHLAQREPARRIGEAGRDRDEGVGVGRAELDGAARGANRLVRGAAAPPTSFTSTVPSGSWIASPSTAAPARGPARSPSRARLAPARGALARRAGPAARSPAAARTC